MENDTAEIRARLLQAMSAPEAVDADWLGEVQQRWPYFALPTALLLRHDKSLDEAQRRAAVEKAIIFANDRAAFLALAQAPECADVADFYPPDQRKRPETTDAISTFLDNYGHQTAEDDAVLERLIFNPVPDYAGVLEAEEKQEPRTQPQPASAPAAATEQPSQIDLIDAFLAKMAPQPAYTETEPEPEPEPDTSIPVGHPEHADSTMLQESLAKTYIRQRRYAKAYEIISNLNLNFPEKSIYFADQLRFLQKLMDLEGKKAQNEAKN